ncbi:hypothetical protein [Nitrosomonas sp. Nm84]|uniref:hypothetical protein n=1 Tax=Nitrosomonas sp. Nm84 TaxID=200124 RepID=UPI001045BABD|nr:hypothetical protein [Nitrosomonas sp. Nm84]
MDSIIVDLTGYPADIAITDRRTSEDNGIMSTTVFLNAGQDDKEACPMIALARPLKNYLRCHYGVKTG